jgi:pimeloyl-ACP methyl ester carboxylesterase
MTATFLPVPGGRLHVVDEGDPENPAVVLLHAGIADLRAWDAIVPHLTDAGYRVVRYDTRGYGRSTAEDVPFSNRADVLAVLDALGIVQAVLVGNSRGGQIAFDTAIEFPDRVVGVVGVAAGFGGFEGQPTPEELALFDEMDRLESADPPDPDAIVDIDLRVWVDGPGQPTDRVPAALRDKVGLMDRPQYLPGHVYGQPVPLEPNANDRIAELRQPVLAVAGELDVSDVAQTARHLEANAPRARAIVWPDVAHMIGMEVPDRLAAEIVGFLAVLPRWS